MKQLIIDTDVGTDVDDLFALAYAMKNPKINVSAVTTVLGDTIIRAKIVKKLGKLLGISVPVTAGERGPEESVRKYWTGIEHLTLTKEEAEESFENESYPHYGNGIVIAAIGPLTNIAKQIKENSSIRNVGEIYIMGSSMASHNFVADLDAAAVVIGRRWKKFLITKDISEKVSFTKEELANFKGTEVGDLLYDSAMRWLNHTNRKQAVMYDVLTVSAAGGEGFVKFKKEKDYFVSYDVSMKLKCKIAEMIKNET
ncbi:nucleoside hydrolase [Candidatus Woesearchaeota archaeon]|nr:nucleoside hydrolase [Candidatus Woesearchaeota archaeon]